MALPTIRSPCRALQRALDAGITFFDTSSGRLWPERAIDRAGVPRDRDRVLIATKAGFTTWNGQPDFSPHAIGAPANRVCTAAERPRRLLQLHNPDLATIAREDVIATLDGLVRQGKARAWGLSMRAPADALATLRSVNRWRCKWNLI